MSYKNQEERKQQGRNINQESKTSSTPISQRYTDNRPETQSMAQLYAAIRANTIANKPSYMSGPNPPAQRQVHPLSQNRTKPPVQRKEVENGDFHIQMAKDEMAKAPVTQRFEVPPVSENEDSLQMKSDTSFNVPPVSQSEDAPIQQKENNTGLPNQLKSGIENLSGYSMDDVKVHYNSNKPAQLQAHAYAQGTDIHVASGQEKHLPHEAWHVVQQKQGRVKPTLQMKGKVNVNDDVGLEREADVMGAKLLQTKKNKDLTQRQEVLDKTIQRRAENPYHHSSHNPDMDDRGTSIDKPNSAHHIIPHSDLKAIYESIADIRIDTALRKKLVKRYLPDKKPDGSEIDKDDIIDKYFNEIQDDTGGALSLIIPAVKILKEKDENTYDKLGKKNKKLKQYFLLANTVNLKTEYNNYLTTFYFNDLLEARREGLVDSTYETNYYTHLADITPQLSTAANFTCAVLPSITGTMIDDRPAIIKEVNGYLEWGQGNQFYGPNAQQRFEAGKTEIDSIGEFFIDFDTHKEKDGYDYVEEHGNNLKAISAGGAELKAYAIKMLVHYNNRIKKLETEKKKLNPSTDVGKIKTIDDKIASKKKKRDRVQDIKNGTGTTQQLINEVRLIEQAKIGKIITGKPNKFNANHWIKIEITNQPEIIQRLFVYDNISNPQATLVEKDLPTPIDSHYLGIFKKILETSKLNNYIHYSEILGKKQTFEALKKLSGSNALTFQQLAAFEGTPDGLLSKAETAIKDNPINAKQITMMVNNDIDIDTLDKGQVSKVIVNRIIDKSMIEKLLEFHADKLSIKQVINLKDISSLKKAAFDNLVQFHFTTVTDLHFDAFLKSPHASKDKIEKISIQNLENKKLAKLLTYKGKDITHSQFSSLNIKSLSPNTFKLLITEYLKKLTEEQIHTIQFSTLDENLLNKIILTTPSSISKIQIKDVSITNLNQKTLNIFVEKHLKNLTLVQKNGIKLEKLETPILNYYVSNFAKDLNSIQIKKINKGLVEELDEKAVNSLVWHKGKLLKRKAIKTIKKHNADIWNKLYYGKKFASL